MYMSGQHEGREAQKIFKRFPKRRNFSCRNSHPEKYILEGETREIGQVITTKKPHCNATIVTFKFTQLPQENFAHKMMSPSKVDLNRRRNANRDMYAHNIRPLTSNLNLATLRVASCEVRQLESEICNRRSSKKIMEEVGCGLEVQGSNMRSTCFEGGFVTRASTTASTRMRLTAGSFRVKSHQAAELGAHSNSIELVDFLRRPNFKKDHFVFSMADKTDSPDTRIEVFRDFLWKVNYSNGIFAITPSDMSCYKAFIGKGNNSIMVKGILRHRSWWTIVQDPSQANFVWTQLKVNSYFETQPYRKVEFSLKDIYSGAELKQKEEQKIDASGGASEAYSRLFNYIDLRNWQLHYKKNIKTEERICSSTYMKRVGLLNKKRLFKIDNPMALHVQNHLVENYYIGNKKALFYNIKRYYDHINKAVFEAVPLTFHLTKGIEDPNYTQFLLAYQKMQEQKKTDKELRNIWIMKPGESTNRGNGISVCFNLDDVQLRLKSKERNKDGTLRTFILQKYIEKPLLFNGRKFDLRHYMLVTCFAGSMRGYWYSEGYVRTSSSLYSLKNGKDLFVHLTNDAIQKNGDNYGKYESGNKLSYQEIQKYIAKVSRKDDKGRAVSFANEILPKMREIAMDSIKATYHLLDRTRKHHNFQLLGLDFMIDDQYHPLLIEVNTNPCLELSCPLLESIIPPLIENTLKITIDPLFPPPEGVQASKKTPLYCDNPIQDNKFHLIFDELMQQEQLKQLFEGRERMGADLGNIQEDDSEFQNDGSENWEEGKTQ